MHPREVICFARLAGSGVEGENYTTLVPWKWIPLEPSKMKIGLRQGTRGLELQVQNKNVVPFFHAELKGWEGHFEGDWKVLRPGGRHVFPWVPHFEGASKKLSLSQARKRLKVITF
jgi:hypothetical protein